MIPLPTGDQLRTDRLLLRRWRPGDREPFAAMNADVEVMEFFPALLTRPQSDALADASDALFDQKGIGRWAVEVPGQCGFIGYVGVAPAHAALPFASSMEVGWRLDRAQWGHGYATEAAQAALADGFDRIGLDEVVSMTYEGNVRSRRVMERLGMSQDPSDPWHQFEHVGLPVGHPLRTHVLYRLSRHRWAATPRR